MYWRIIFTVFIVCLLHVNAMAQSIHHVKIGINGLHCSACTFSVEKSLQKLDFVRLIQMDLNKRSGLVYLHEEMPYDVDALAKAVKDAGFSVRSLIIVFEDQLTTDMVCLDNQFCIVKNNSIAANQGATIKTKVAPSKERSRIRIVGKEFLERKAFREMEETLSTPCHCPAEKTYRAIRL